jgi:Collagen triple helix repeat (20 copies)
MGLFVGRLRLRLFVMMTVMVGGAAPGFAAQAVLVADAHVNAALPAVNSGAISNLRVGGGYTALVQFDLSTLPMGTTAAQVSRAVLRLYCNRVDTAGLVSFQSVGGVWGEYSVTYGSLPALGSAAQVVQVSEAGAFVAVDVTALVQGWITAPATNNGLALTAGTAAVQFDSKENDLTGHAAELDVSLVSQGPAGAIGLTGATGAVGPVGATGPQGPIGLPGATGPQGPQGVAGPIGLTGPAGAAGSGAAGPVGPAGPAGPQGLPGMVYQGNYSSVTNYALGDVVLWQGTSYTSLMAGNHGNTPNDSPGEWGVLSPQGPMGATGATGAAGPAGPQGLPGSVGPPGEQGPQGLQGIAGQAGAQGLTGATGAQGLSGPMGPQGPAGPVGMTFRGVYSSTTNYGLADGVTYNGAAYVSLVASNQGNTPDQSPAQWGLFATGGVGPAGPAGAAGAPGLQGPVGPQGLAGAIGATGATGQQGPPVANYTGNYGSTTNYALHDAVSYQGSTYISLVAGNVGNTPGLSPVQWALLAAQGPVGATGAAGAAGATGATGPAGAAGAVGPQGPPVSFVGGWLVGQSYGVGDAVSYGGSSYIALTANTGREPDVSPVYWGVLAQAGSVGPAGATGATGLQGPTGFPGPQGVAGPAGPIGAVGPQGPVGVTGPAGPIGATGATGAAGLAGLAYRGAYGSTTNYGLNDGVTYLGSSYISLAANNVGNSPDASPAFWGLLAAQGAVGATGPAGATGPVGPQGNSGAAGAAGPQGPAGLAGMTYRGAWSGGTSYAVNDAVLFGGTTYIATAGAAGLEPDLYPAAWSVLAQQGGVGPSGPTGAAATVTVGTVTTGLAGSAAAVTNSGTANTAVLNFTIPQGAAGTNGSGGGSGGGGLGSFASMYHAVSFNTKYYSLNTPNASLTEDPSVLAWVPLACTATTLSVSSQQGNAVTVTLRQGASGSSGSMADTVLACTAAAGGTCSVTGSVAVAAGSFLDLSVTGANANTAGVWTAVGCN